MIVYNYTSKPVFINVGVVPDPYGGPGHGEITILLPPNGEGGLDLKAYGIMTKEEKLAK